MAYQAWHQAKKALETATNEAQKIQIESERLEWQLNEFQEAHLQENEWEDINQRYDTLAHAADILEVAQKLEQLIDDDGGVQSQLYHSTQSIGDLAHLDPRFQESLNLLQSIEAELGEISSNMRDVMADTDIDPKELAEQEARLNTLNQLARKYRIEPENLRQHQQHLAEALSQLQAASDLDALEKQVATTQATYYDFAKQLSKLRHQAALVLGEKTSASLQTLAMQGATFAIDLQACEPTAYGIEHIQYMVATNRGSQLKPMSKVASGGELSRISLSLQVVTSALTTVPTLIFDEVDTGIGGRVAQVVGEALQELGKSYQILAITHLPQVAACGNQHWLVSKREVNDLTISQIHPLSPTERVDEIARMLGGEVLTDTTKEHAKELLQSMARSH